MVNKTHACTHYSRLPTHDSIQNKQILRTHFHVVAEFASGNLRPRIRYWNGLIPQVDGERLHRQVPTGSIFREINAVFQDASVGMIAVYSYLIISKLIMTTYGERHEKAVE